MSRKGFTKAEYSHTTKDYVMVFTNEQAWEAINSGP